MEKLNRAKKRNFGASKPGVGGSPGPGTPGSAPGTQFLLQAYDLNGRAIFVICL